MGRQALMIDLERCIGCKSCEVACKQEHGLGPGEYRNRVLWLGKTDHPQLDFLTVTCQHCERPACLRACPVNPKAIVKDEATGIVRVIEDRCTGCGECVAACPYGAMGYDPVGHHSVKCDLCTDRRAEGASTTACESVCPGHAITFGERADHVAYAEREGRTVRDTNNFLMGPATVYLERTHRDVDTSLAARIPSVMDGARGGAVPDARPTYPYSAPREERRADRVVPGGCNICFNSCPTKYHFHGQTLVKVTGNEEDPIFKGKVCPKSQLSVQLYNSENRLQHPMKRVGERGEGRFERITWEQALDEIAARMKEIAAKTGPESVAIFAGTRTGTLTRNGHIKMFAQMFGTPNYEGTDPFCASGKHVAYETVQGDNTPPNSYTDTDIGSATLYVYFGDNQAEARPVYFGMINDWRVRNKARLLVIDPRLTATASKADRWLPIRTGTDMALALGMAHHILEAQLHDTAFCDKWVVGWTAWRDFIRERGYTPQWASTITGVPVADIVATAEEIASAERCIIFASRGINQHTNGTQTNRALMFLAAITGNWAKPGGGFLNLSISPTIAANAPPHRRAKFNKPLVRRSPTGWVDAIKTGRPYPLRALIACNNPLSNWPGQNEVRDAFQALDLLVHIELFENETSAFADYVLPAATGIEKGEIGRANDDRRVVWIDKMIEPPGEAKSDDWIWIELGKRFGYEDVMLERYKDSAVFWDEMCIDNDHLRGITQKRLHEQPSRWLRYPLPSENHVEQETLFLDTGDARRFPTPSGKLEFYTEELEARFNTLGLSALPEFYAEREYLVDLPYVEFTHGDETPGCLNPFHKLKVLTAPARIRQPGPDSPGARLRQQGFDLELITGRPPAPHFHSWTHYAWQAQEMWPDLYVQIHPNAAARVCVSDGERVKVQSGHGEIEAIAWVTRGIRETSVFIPIGWGERQPHHPWQSVNFLTDRNQRDPLSDQTNTKSLLCRVVKIA